MNIFTGILQALRVVPSGSDSTPRGDATPTSDQPAGTTADVGSAGGSARKTVIDTEIAAIQGGLKEMRSLLQTAGSLLAAGGTAVVGGLGYQQLHNFFPLPPNDRLQTRVILVLAALISALAAALGAASLARQFLVAQRRILLSSDLAECTDLKHPQELRIVERSYADVAGQEQACTLADVDLRAERLSRASRIATDQTLAAALQSESDRLESMVELGIFEAAAAVLERRSANAFRGPGTLTSLVIAIVGIALVFGLADYSKGERDKLTVIQACTKLTTKPAHKNTAATFVPGTSNWCKS